MTDWYSVSIIPDAALIQLSIPQSPLPVIFEQDSEIHGVLHFGQQQQLIPDPEWGTPHFPAEDDGLGQILVPAASHLAAKHSSVS